MAIALETVVKQLEDSGIVAQGKLENFIPPKAHPKNVEELVSELVKQNHLTKFQAQQVAQGKVRALILGGYTILDKIGAGGMGQVFKAEHRRMKRLVAVKMLPPAMTKDAAATARFQREVEAAAKLEHPNIVTAYDADQANGAHFLVMQYVEGKDLSAMVKKDGPFPVAKAVNYILQAARGLEFAHSEGVIHRDIKPANLLLDKKGVVKILDMGLARIDGGSNAPAQAELTGTGAVMGTVDYMAPEQAMSTRDADARADIYSLGCSLHYLIAGKATYGGESVIEKLLAHREKPIPNLRDVAADVSAELEAVFRKMVAKNIEDRYQTMTEVVADLEKCSSGQSTSVSIQQSTGTNLDSGALSSFPNIQVTPTIQKTRITKQVATAKSSEGKQPPWKNTKVLIGAGAAGFLFLLLGVWVIVRDKDGKPIAKVEVPYGGSVKVQEVKKSPFAKPAKQTNPTKAPATTTSVTPKTVPGTTPGKLFINDPAFQQWTKTVAALPAKAQVDAVTKKLQELNPGFDGKVTGFDGKGSPNIENGVVTELHFSTETMSDLSPVRALAGLKVLECTGRGSIRSTSSDLSPLQGLHLTKLNCSSSSVSDLAPLRGMPLTDLAIQKTNVSDLSPLKGMSLTRLSFSNQPIADLSPIQGMPLETLACDYALFSDLSLLRGMPLTSLSINKTKVSDLAPLQGMPITVLSCTGTEVADLSPLLTCKSLKTLTVKQTRVTAASVAALQKALPNCKIEWDDPAKATTPQPAAPVGTQPPLAKAPFDAAQAKAHQAAWAKHLGTTVESVNSVGAKMVLIPPGEFLMGSSDEQVEAALKVAEGLNAEQGLKDRIQKERPQRRVVITKPLMMGATEITVGQFKKFGATGYQTEAEKAAESKTYLNPGYAMTDDLPVTFVTWNDAVAYCKWLSAQEKATYRLPTEAEWEYACRVGTTTQYSSGDDVALLNQYGWYDKNAAGKIHPVGTKLPNGFGLFDMHGNACEWCGDYFDEKWYSASSPNDPKGPSTGSLRVIRGGDWHYNAFYSRSALRFNNTPSARYHNFSFRIVRELDGSASPTASTATTTASVTPQPVPVGVPGKLFIHDPAFQAWMNETQALAAGKQIEAVSKKLMELNPGFDGKLTGWRFEGTPSIEDSKVTVIGVSADQVHDISPIRALSTLKILGCASSDKKASKFFDLSPLHGMQLEQLYIWNTKVAELAPLKGMPLTVLQFTNSDVVDLTPLNGMPLESLTCNGTLITDLSPLEACKSLKKLYATGTKVTATGVAALQKALPNCKIESDFSAPPTVPVTAADLDRVAAEWVLSCPKSLVRVEFVNEPGKRGAASDAAQLPPGPFRNTGIRIGPKMNGAHSVGKLNGLSYLSRLDVSQSGTTDAEMTQLKNLPQLNILVLSETKVTDKTVQHVAAEFRSLVDLDLQLNPGITDASLKYAESLPALTKLSAQGTSVTAAGVAALQKALPNCKIQWDDPAKATPTDKK